MAYLIDVLGLNREIAKALIIDAARGWNDAPTPEEVALYGHGIVPIKITDIIQYHSLCLICYLEGRGVPAPVTVQKYAVL